MRDLAPDIIEAVRAVADLIDEQGVAKCEFVAELGGLIGFATHRPVHVAPNGGIVYAASPLFIQVIQTSAKQDRLSIVDDLGAIERLDLYGAHGVGGVLWFADGEQRWIGPSAAKFLGMAMRRGLRIVDTAEWTMVPPSPKWRELLELEKK